MEKTAHEIFTTTDYSIFKKLRGNRDISEDKKRVEGIKDSILKNGYKPNPIRVNEKMEVIDGQGRLEALKELMLPVEFQIFPGENINDCRALNSAGKVWKPKDYIYSYADEGIDAFVKIKQLMKEFGYNERIVGIPLKLRLSVKKKIISKNIKISDEEYQKARKTLAEMNKYDDAVKKYHGRYCSKYEAICYMVTHGVNTQEMLKAIRKTTPDEFNSSTKESMIRSFQDAYNKGKIKNNRIYIYESYRKGE